MERVQRINDCKVELGRCSDEELAQMAQDAMQRAELAEREVRLISEELHYRHRAVDMPLEEVA